MAMTKLIEWLLALAAFTGVYAMLVAHAAQPDSVLHPYELLVLSLPLILIAVFGVYAVFVVLYRVFTFNDCEEAAAELNKQIKEAKEDLNRKGFVVSEKT